MYDGLLGTCRDVLQRIEEAEQAAFAVVKGGPASLVGASVEHALKVSACSGGVKFNKFMRPIDLEANRGWNSEIPRPGSFLLLLPAEEPAKSLAQTLPTRQRCLPVRSRLAAQAAR